MRLSTKTQWEERWKNGGKSKLAFDPCQPLFRDTNRILQRLVPKSDKGKFLEVGAYPGKYLWYFYKYFGYEPWGVEYVESCASRAQDMLDSHKVPAKIIADDFFNINPGDHSIDGGWDLVASFGFVEHFENPTIAVSKHLEVAKPGGLVVISVPNHAGWNGSIMRVVDKEKWSQHNCMALSDLVSAFDNAGNNKILFAGYVGHIGFWNVCVYENAKRKMGKWYPVLRAPLWIVEKIGRLIVPNNAKSSPEMILIARKQE